MNQPGQVNRRDFLRKSILGAGLGALAGGLVPAGMRTVLGEEPAAAPPPAAPPAPIPKVQHRRLGRTNIEISEIAGAADSLGEQLLFANAWQAGVNYFHKAEKLFHHDWARTVLEKHRAEMFLDVVIDQMGEDEAYAEFERKRQQIGSDYVDFFKVHSTWKTVEDFQAKRGMLAAYDRLQKEKKVRWLALSKHGENTPDVLIAAMESGLFDAIQPAVKNCGTDFQKVLKVAQEKNIGVICMKTGAGAQGKKAEFAKFGDPDKPFQTYYRYLLAQPGITAIVSNMKNMDQLRENLGASGRPMTQAEVEALGLALARSPADYRDCVACGQCHGSCPEELAVADVMRYRMYAEDYGDRKLARELYSQLPASWRATVATGHGLDSVRCPYGLPLAAELQRAHHWLA